MCAHLGCEDRPKWAAWCCFHPINDAALLANANKVRTMQQESKSLIFTDPSAEIAPCRNVRRLKRLVLADNVVIRTKYSSKYHTDYSLRTRPPRSESGGRTWSYRESSHSIRNKMFKKLAPSVFLNCSDSVDGLNNDSPSIQNSEVVVGRRRCH